MDRREAIAALMTLPATTRVSCAQVRPTDVIVLEIPHPISEEDARNLSTRVRQIWPEPQRIVVLADGITLKIIDGQVT